MTNHAKMFVYEIQAFAYSDFTHWTLLHERQFTRTEFRKMIEKARQKAKPKPDKTGMIPVRFPSYPVDVIEVLKEDYGFIESEHLIGHVGCHYDDICEVIENDQ